MREFVIAGRKQTASRISVLTGVHRKEVARILAAALPSDEVAAHRITCAAGVVAGWRRDERFADPKGKPADLFVNELIKGFTEALQLMKEGDKWQLFVPTDLAYGLKSPPNIPPNAALIFELELVKVNGPAKTP